MVHRDPRLSYFLGGGEGADKTNEEVLNVVTSRSIINRSFSRSMSRNVPFEPPLSKRECTEKEKFSSNNFRRKSIHRIHMGLSIYLNFQLISPPFVRLHIYNNTECKLKINDLLRHKYLNARKEIHRREINRHLDFLKIITDSFPYTDNFSLSLN